MTEGQIRSLVIKKLCNKCPFVCACMNDCENFKKVRKSIEMEKEEAHLMTQEEREDFFNEN